jgi:TPR repeat protein
MAMAKLLSALLALVATAFTLADARAEKRVALLVGNAAYEHVATLPNPVNDVAKVAEVLRKAGFDVVVGSDLTRLAFEDSVRRFLRSAAGADIGLFYYAGHGVQVGNENFLVPVDAQLKAADDLEVETISFDGVLKGLQAKTRAQLVFLDACRDFPLDLKGFYVGPELRPVSATRGLARMDATAGSLLVYSTSPGTVAWDGAGDASPFTAAFSQHALRPNREVRQVISDVRRDVMAATSGQQVPWESSSLTEDLFLVRRTSAPVVPPVVTVGFKPEAETPLDLPMPRHPDGDIMKVRIDAVPTKGVLEMAKGAVGKGDILSLEDFRSLAYRSRQGEAAPVDVVAYSVLDAAGNEARGSVALVRGAAATARSEVEKDVEGTKQLMAGLDGASIEAPIGVGPRPLLPTAILGTATIEGAAVEVTEPPASGILRVDGRPVGKGAVPSLAEAAKLTFEPQVGTDGQPLRVVLGLRDRSGNTAGRANLSITPRLDPCDVLAGEPLDLQGVAPGLQPNDIKADEAIAACTAAVAAYPDVPRFQFQLGRAHLAGRNLPAAQVAIRIAHARGHARATFRMGYMAQHGVGEAVDAAKAVGLYKAAAMKGDPFALFAYGRALYHGKGIAQDRGTGLAMMERAAELGHTYAMNELGAIYHKGDGVRADPGRGAKFYQAGVDRNDIYSFSNLAIAYSTGEGVPADIGKAMSLYKRAIDAGHPLAPNEVGRLYFNGIGVEKDMAEAVKWYRLGAERGDAWAASNLAFILEKGLAGSADPAEAARLYALAASLDQPQVSLEAKRALAKLGRAPKAESARALAARLSRPPPAKVNDDALIKLSRAVWDKSNPRLDLF